MDTYSLEVVKEGQTIAAWRSVALRNSSAAWPKIAEMAKSVDEPGCQIRVTNAAGEIVILVGVASARRYLHPDFEVARNHAQPNTGR